ncbi:MAG: GDSL-type esterase/lipase family protein [Dysgonomonas sp.]|nr:GDSL-type esterase/lipase family protein [Dysgonomonas sp.]
MKKILLLTIILSLLNSCNLDNNTNLQVYKRPYKQSLAGKKILLYGDSISSTDYVWYKEYMELLTGAEVYNAGFSGFNTAQLAKNEQLQRIWDYNPDLIICLVGGNDSGTKGSVGSFGNTQETSVDETDIDEDYLGTHFIQAASHIMKKIEQYYNLQNTSCDSICKPYLVFCTPLPQKRENDSNPFSQKENWERKRDAIVEVCSKYQVHCIDLYNYCSWDFSQEPYWTSPTDMTTNRGVYTMDGLHPNKYGYEYIARVICGDLAI